MNDFQVNRDNAAVERLKKDLRELEYEEQRLNRDLEKNKEKQRQVLNELSKYSDEKYEQDMLTLVYQQRMAERRKGK